MAEKRTLLKMVSSVLLAGVISGCHFAGHVPPGQAKKVVAPPPGHVGNPPKQFKKY